MMNEIVKILLDTGVLDGFLVRHPANLLFEAYLNNGICLTFALPIGPLVHDIITQLHQTHHKTHRNIYIINACRCYFNYH